MALRLDLTVPLVSCRGPRAVHVGAYVGGTRRREGRVGDALGVETEAAVLGVVLADGQGAGDDFGLVAVAPAGLVVVGVIFAGGFGELEVGVVEDGLGVFDRQSGVDSGRHRESSW